MKAEGKPIIDSDPSSGSSHELDYDSLDIQTSVIDDSSDLDKY